MSHRSRRVLAWCAVATALLVTGCSAPIPREEVPPGWALDVHQPGEWWTQPLIPRSVIVQRCPPERGWSSEPDLTKVTALPPGSDVNYIRWTDDYHCDIGWSEPTSDVDPQAENTTSEAGLRAVCSSTGLPMDAGWRYLGRQATQRAGDLSDYSNDELRLEEGATAGFIDEYGTVVGCMGGGDYGGAFVKLSVGADTAPNPATPVCPVTADSMAAGENGTVEEYRLRGAGAVRDDDGRVLTKAATLRIGLIGDSLTTTHPVVDGIAIVDAWVAPRAAIHGDEDKPPPVEGQVLGADGTVLATCRA